MALPHCNLSRLLCRSVVCIARDLIEAESYVPLAFRSWDSAERDLSVSN